MVGAGVTVFAGAATHAPKSIAIRAGMSRAITRMAGQ
jgi:hypothetical protein